MIVNRILFYVFTFFLINTISTSANVSNNHISSSILNSIAKKNDEYENNRIVTLGKNKLKNVNIFFTSQINDVDKKTPSSSNSIKVLMFLFYSSLGKPL